MLPGKSSNDEAYKNAHSVLFLDDQELGDLMERSGTSVDAARDSGKAIAVLEKQLYPLMDPYVPMPGWETLLERLRAIRPDISHTPALRLNSATQVDRAPTLLLAEGDPHSGETLQDYFEAKGFNTIWAKDGIEAIQAFRENSVDLALVDIMMPGADGYEVCQTIKSESLDRSVPVIFLTAKASPEDEVAGFECGADGYVAKPYDLSVVRAQVDARLNIKTRSDKSRNEGTVGLQVLATDPPASIQ